MASQQAGYSDQGLWGRLHEVMAGGAVNVRVHKAWGKNSIP